MADAPDPFSILAQQPVQMPQMQQAPAAQPTLAPQPVKGHNAKAPGVYSLIHDLIKQPTQTQVNQQTGMAEARPVSRLNVFEDFLGNFLNSLGQGMANQGHGPGSFGRGFGAAVQAPMVQQANQQQLALQQQQLQNEQTQGQIAQQNLSYLPTQHAAQIAALTQQPRFGTNGQYLGNMNDAQYQQYLRGGQAAQINAQSRMSVEQMKAQLLTGQVARVIPTQTENGLVMRAYNKYNKPIGDIDGALPPSAYIPKTSSTVEYKQLEDGSIVALPKTTTSGPNIPGAKSKGGVSGPIHVQNGTVVGADGQPLQFKGGITGTTKTMIETAPKVEDLVSRTIQLVNQQKDSLGPAASRWNEYITGKIGAPNPEFAKLRTDTGLLQTLLMRMHVGARGGEQIMQHFKELIDSGKQSPENLLAALGEIQSYAKEVGSSRGIAGQPSQQNNGRRVIDLSK